MSCASFGCNSPGEAAVRNVYDFCLQGVDHSLHVQAAEVPSICAALQRPSVPDSVLSSPGEGLQFVEAVEGEVNVDILVGQDFYWRLMTPEIVSIAPGLVAQRTIFGWVMSGLLPEDHSSPRVQSNVSVSHQLLCCDVSESMVRKFWDLESIGVVGRESQLEDPVMRDFCEKVQFVDGRYSVALPWKDESVRPRLLDNEQQARARLNHLSQRLSKNLELETRYHQVIQDMQQAGVIEEVPADQVRVPTGSLVYYMPHRPVVKESSISTKVRPVFDASAKGHNNVSPNDCLETGPSLIPDLLGILMRFRRWKFALCADITKAFLQVGVHPVKCHHQVPFVSVSDLSCGGGADQ